MILQRPGASRGHVTHGGWLDSRHTFSFGQYHDPAWMGFGPLRVINEDRVAGGGGFPPHSHANMEIISLVLDGALAHRDSSGGGGTIGPGEVQWMGAGHGVQHSEYNASQTVPVHFLQVWIQPNRVNAAPGYGQRAAREDDASGRWVRWVSADGADGSVAIRQDAAIDQATLAPGARIARSLDASRRAWLQVTRGAVTVDGQPLAQGDALGFVDEGAELAIVAGADVAQVLVFDLPRD